MRARQIMFGLMAISFINLNGDYSEQQKEQDPNQYLYPDQLPKKPQKPDEEVADRRSNEFEYNLYDRQLNRREQQERDDRLQQQYYYQQSPGNNGNTQYRRTQAQRSQYFNPIDD